MQWPDIRAKLPVPPHTSDYKIDGKDNTCFTLKAIYSDRSDGDLITFYRDFFEKNGWTIEFDHSVKSLRVVSALPI